MIDQPSDYIEELKNIVKRSLYDRLEFTKYKRMVRATVTLLAIRSHIKAQQIESDNRYFVTAIRSAESAMRHISPESIDESKIMSMAKSVFKQYNEAYRTGQIREKPILMDEIEQLVEGEISIDEFCKMC